MERLINELEHSTCVVSVTPEQCEFLLNHYPARLDYEEDDEKEYFLCESGGGPLMALSIDGHSIVVASFGKPVEMLRQDLTFLNALCTDCDVNHALHKDKQFGWTMDNPNIVFDWLLKKTNETPITFCGCANYVTNLIRHRYDNL